MSARRDLVISAHDGDTVAIAASTATPQQKAAMADIAAAFFVDIMPMILKLWRGTPAARAEGPDHPSRYLGAAIPKLGKLRAGDGCAERRMI